MSVYVFPSSHGGLSSSRVSLIDTGRRTRLAQADWLLSDWPLSDWPTGVNIYDVVLCAVLPSHSSIYHLDPADVLSAATVPCAHEVNS